MVIKVRREFICIYNMCLLPRKTKQFINICKISLNPKNMEAFKLIWHVFRNLSTFCYLLFIITMPTVSLSLYIQSSYIFTYTTEGKIHIVPTAGSELLTLKSIGPKALLFRNSNQ